MENLGRAMQMAGAVLLFIVAASTSIYLYSSVMNYTKTVITESDRNNRAEFAFDRDKYNKREITEAEVIMALITINNMNVNEIHVNNSIYKPVDEIHINVNSNEYEISKYDFKDKVSEGNYIMEYDAANNIILYKGGE